VTLQMTEPAAEGALPAAIEHAVDRLAVAGVATRLAAGWAVLLAEVAVVVAATAPPQAASKAAPAPTVLHRPSVRSAARRVVALDKAPRMDDILSARTSIS